MSKHQGLYGVIMTLIYFIAAEIFLLIATTLFLFEILLPEEPDLDAYPWIAMLVGIALISFMAGA